jgi:hypothetical protein
MSDERILLTDASPEAALRALDEDLAEEHRTLSDRLVLRDGNAIVEAYTHVYDPADGVPYDELLTAVDATCNRADGEGRYERSNELVAQAAAILRARGMRVLVVEDLERVVE